MFYYLSDTDTYKISDKPPSEPHVKLTFNQYCAGRHPDLYAFDIEIYPNVFTCTVVRPSDMGVWRFQISPLVNQGVEFYLFLINLRDINARMVGFNNMGFDYPVIHEVIRLSGYVTVDQLYDKAQAIIDAPHEDRNKHVIWSPEIKQVDLYKIHHFDNVARATSLKMLEFNMRSENIQDLPYKSGVPLQTGQIDPLITYNDHDVFETIKFLEHSLPMIEFRDELTEKYGRDFTNHNDTKIGKDYFVMELEKNGVQCFEGRRPIQTHRPYINLNDVIIPSIEFRHPEFIRIYNWFRSQTITETKGVFKDVSCTVDGFDYDFGTGGIHGSVASRIVSEDDEFALFDLDVKSYYPNLAIANGFYPAHLGVEFCDICRTMYLMRVDAQELFDDNISAMLKLALNGVYGDSNNKYSPFYDPAYTMAITINGQLLLCLLADWLRVIPDLTMVQINTDGLTVRLPRVHTEWLNNIARQWEQRTGLVLEDAHYSRMMIRDVNSYIAEYTDGKLKRKGAYGYGKDLGWHQNHSSQVVAIAAENALVKGISVEETIYSHTDMMDFMRRTKVPRNSRLMCGDQQVQNITRYYVSNSGAPLTKIMPPTANQLKKNPDAPERRIGIDKGFNVTPCNDMRQVNRYDINYDYYILEAKKLTEPLL